MPVGELSANVCPFFCIVGQHNKTSATNTFAPASTHAFVRGKLCRHCEQWVDGQATTLHFSFLGWHVPDLCARGSVVGPASSPE